MSRSAPYPHRVQCGSTEALRPDFMRKRPQRLLTCSGASRRPGGFSGRQRLRTPRLRRSLTTTDPAARRFFFRFPPSLLQMSDRERFAQHFTAPEHLAFAAPRMAMSLLVRRPSAGRRR